jgi:[ribosomal protein S5]-alanine N-acetyltransferase
MEISFQGLTLRPWTLKDSASLAEFANNTKIAINLRDFFPSPYLEKDARKWIRIVKDLDPVLNFAIICDGAITGNIGLVTKENIYRKNLEIGYFIGEKFWGRGIATRAIMAVTDYAFTTFDIERVYAEVFAGNIASCRALEKAGFSLEARLKNYIFKNGVLLDGCIYSTLRT